MLNVSRRRNESLIVDLMANYKAWQDGQKRRDSLTLNDTPSEERNEHVPPNPPRPGQFRSFPLFRSHYKATMRTNIVLGYD
jgi:hypothetical protein